MHTRTFWYIAASNGVTNLIMSAVSVHLFLHLVQGVGLSTKDAALAFGVMNFVNIGGRLIAGYLGDRYNKRLLLVVGALGTGASLLLLAGARAIEPVLAFGVLYGVCWGFRVPLGNSQTGDYFGRAAYGRLMGTMQLISSPLGIVGPIAAGLIADQQGGYQGVLVAFAALSILAAGAMFLAFPPTTPARLREAEA
jgi:MFS family permease